jgi:hypothetical protein
MLNSFIAMIRDLAKDAIDAADAAYGTYYFTIGHTIDQLICSLISIVNPRHGYYLRNWYRHARFLPVCQFHV